LFAFGINYNDPQHGGTPLYNGNISETEWRTANIDNTLKWYKYEFDALDRINSATDNTGNYSLSNVTYDKNGNIMTLTRNGWQNSSTYTNMDVLDYDYDSGNKLLKVADTGNDLYGFKDDAVNISDASNDYSYDQNGNLTRDDNKDITDIEYNHLNMPTKITATSSDAGTLDYIYDATGVKVRKINSNGTTTDYIGNFVYEGGNLKQISHTEGYIEPDGSGGYDYVYYIKDLQDNVRITFADDNNDGNIDPLSEIRREQNYSPFGLEHKGYNDAIFGAKNDLKTFQNQEFTEDLGLNIHEWRYRFSDPTIGRFWQIDPLAEDFVYNSTYAFSENSPVAYVELEGLEKVLAIFYHGGPTGGGKPTSVGAAGETGQYFERTRAATESAGREFSGTIIAPGVTSYSGVQAGLRFAAKNLVEGDQIIIYGYSYGVDVAVDLAEEFGSQGIDVDLLVTVDGSDGPLQNSTVNTDIPENVDTNLNIYQTEDSGASSSSRSTGATSSGTSSGSSNRSNSGSSDSPGSNGGPNTAVNPNKTTVTNKNVTGVGVTHGNIQQKVKTIVQPVINAAINNYPRN